MYTPTKTHDFFFVLGLWGVGQKTAFDYLWQRRKTRMQLSLQKVTHKPGVHSFNHLSFANYCYYCWLLPLLLASLCTFCQTWILKCTHSRTEGCLVKLKLYIYINYIKLKLKCVCVCVYFLGDHRRRKEENNGWWWWKCGWTFISCLHSTPPKTLTTVPAPNLISKFPTWTNI